MPRKKYPKSESIPEAPNTMPEKAYVTWDDNDLNSKQQALDESSRSLEEFGLFANKSTAATSRFRNFMNLDGPISGRPGLTKSDYDYFRPDEAVPTEIKAIFAMADQIYNRVGLVKNVIDLMGDFASQGIRLVHPNKRIERFYRNWFEKVKGEERSERFLNHLYRVGNVVVNKQTAKIGVKVAENMYRTKASPDLIINSDEDVVEKREIPWKYTFIDPRVVDIAGASLASFVGKKNYYISIPASLRKIINSPKNEAEAAIVAQLPEAIVESAKSKKPYLLDPNKTLVFHYKKDDWKTWAFPMIYSIMDDISIVEKLKLADLAALDGAISNIRIFKLGSLEHKIAPTQAAASKLSNILQANVGGGTMDLVWGPDIELIESKTAVHQFLGEAKYVPHLNAIYAGLGIPPTLTGTFGAAGTTNNFISLKTLTQRLQYGRKVLTAFWKNEIALVQKAMGFKLPAKIEFDRMDLSNEDAEKALLIQLADRNLISDEMIQKAFGLDADMEKNRLNRENRERDSERMVPKAGPFFDGGTFENSMKKMAMQLGLATPSQVGLELEPKKKGEMNAVEVKTVYAPPKPAFGTPPISNDQPKGQPQQGRPKNVKDSKKRKTKEFAPQTGASLYLWAIEAQDKIAEILNPQFLEFYNKKNMRSLSKAEYDEAEVTKTKIFLSLDPLSTLSEEVVLAKLNTINSIDINNKTAQYNKFIKAISSDINRAPTSDEIKYTKAYFYQTVYSE
ncbi:MAG: hypothetical protein EBS93_08595 [Chitinophagia bacterium]|nr:hypothetical protein [Chitinophagia bacterium]NCA30760.1 hypothetical protein [Chitinophagia bacterium]